MRNLGTTNISSYHSSFKSGLGSDVQNSINNIYNFMYDDLNNIPAQKMCSAQVNNFGYQPNSNTRVTFSWVSQSYSGNVYYGNYESGYKLFLLNASSWHLITTLSFGATSYIYNSPSINATYKITSYNSAGESINPQTVNINVNLPPEINPPILVSAWSNPSANPNDPTQTCRAKLTFTPVSGITDYVLWWEFGDNVYTNCSSSPCIDKRCVKSKRQVCIKNLMNLSSFPYRIDFENLTNDPSYFVSYEDPEGFFYQGTCYPCDYKGRYWIEIESVSEEYGYKILNLHFPPFWAHGADYTFKMASVKDGAVSNWSNTKTCFIVDAPQTITVTIPSGGEQLKAGTQRTIQWTCENFTGSEVMIDYSYDNTYTPKEIKYGAPNTGSYVWTVPEENSTLCQVRVWDPEDWYPWGNSAIFTIYPKEITVLSPDGGEVWTVGTQHDIKWSKYQFNNNVKIEYSIDNGSSWTLVAENIADITYTWTIPDTPSKNCLVRVSDVSNSAIYDLTDKVFEIYYPLPRLTLTSPQAGDSLMTGRNYHILWTSENFTGKVKIEYSANNGINWTTVIDSTENDGLYTWTAPLSPSSHSVLRISSAKTGNPSNTSGVFIVYTPPETFVGGTLSQNTAWKENIRLTSDVIVPSSVTLTISPRTYVNMNGYALKSTGGVITKDSTSIFAPDISVTDWRGNLKGHYSSIQSAINNAVEKQVVRLGTGTFNEDVVLKNGVHLFGKSQSSTIINGKLDYTEGTKATYIHDLTILKPITIISAYDLAFRNVTSKTSFAMFDVVCLFEFVTVENTSGDAVLTWRSSNYNFGFRTLGSGNCAIRATKRSGLVFQDGHVTNLSQAFLILTSTAEIKNSFFCQNTYDLTAYWEATINSLSGNTYSGDASRVFRKDAVSSIIWEYFWKCGLGKASHSLSKSSDEGKENSVPMVSTSDPGMGEYWEAKNQLNFIHENKRRDSELRRSPDQKKYRNEYLDALSKFKTIVEKYPDSLCARLAVHEIGRTCLSMEEPEAGFNYLNTLLKSSKSKKLVFEVMDALVPYYVYTQEYNKALDLLEKLKKDHSKTQPEWEIDFEKGLIYKYHLKDSRKAIEMFKKVIDQCTDESFLSWVKLQLEELGVSELAKKNGPSEETGMGLTIQNVPNPFNPETEIHYRIPESGKVILKIYDILGREVRTLVNEEQNTGSHVALWDGKDEEGRQVSSGTYFYHLRFKDHHITGKMLLMR